MNSLVSKQMVMKEIYKYFKADETMALLVGDMGFAVLDEFFQNHKGRTFNTGICEQATISMSAGMYLAGLKPIVYSQVPFLVMRAYEQIRYDLNEHKMNVKLIGVGADNYFSSLGRSHCMDDDDVDMMNIFKNFKIFSPTQDSLEKDIKNMFEYDGPTYLRCL
ncbi:transketolase [Sulfurimonas lithotrophica]|uniref:Transketolase n=1 Tax=Sulfurimonas lithotrophica TaxID=2590022 RepID=A0A5P8NY66_9BACT|nr:transketolase [Sulfurimonas lithotrophica]QFR48359.1 transketolase [Sulfurimonas lithotrophica]